MAVAAQYVMVTISIGLLLNLMLLIYTTTFAINLCFNL